MRTAAYLLVGFALVLLQGTMHRYFALLGSFVHAPWYARLINGCTPHLVLPFVIYLGIHEQSMARGASMSFALGWAVDIVGGGPAFLFRLTMVAVWWLCRGVSTRVSTQTALSRIPLAFAASLAESLIILALLAIFGEDNRRPLELSSQMLPRAMTTALFSLPLFPLAHRLSLEPRATKTAGAGSGSV
jgi:rod shape-determining protein MreD